MYRRADRHSKAQLGWRVTWRVKAGVVLLIMSSSMIGWNLYPLTQLKTGSAAEPDRAGRRAGAELG